MTENHPVTDWNAFLKGVLVITWQTGGILIPPNYAKKHCRSLIGKTVVICFLEYLGGITSSSICQVISTPLITDHERAQIHHNTKHYKTHTLTSSIHTCHYCESHLHIHTHVKYYSSTLKHNSLLHQKIHWCITWQAYLLSNLIRETTSTWNAPPSKMYTMPDFFFHLLKLQVIFPDSRKHYYTG